MLPLLLVEGKACGRVPVGRRGFRGHVFRHLAVAFLSVVDLKVGCSGGSIGKVGKRDGEVGECRLVPSLVDLHVSSYQPINSQKHFGTLNS